MTSGRCVHMIQEFFLPTLNEMDMGDVWVKQDIATTHKTHMSDCFAATLPRMPHVLEGQSALASMVALFSPLRLFLWCYLHHLCTTIVLGAWLT